MKIYIATDLEGVTGVYKFRQTRETETPEFAAAYFGILRAGCVAVPTNTWLLAPDYAYYLEYARPRVVIVDADNRVHVSPGLKGRLQLSERPILFLAEMFFPDLHKQTSIPVLGVGQLRLRCDKA